MASGYRGEGLHRVPGLIDGIGGNPRLEDGAAVGEAGVGVEQLERRDDRPALTEGHLDVVSDVPAAIGEGLGVGGVQPLAYLRAVDP